MVDIKIDSTETAKAIFWFLLITSIYVVKGSIESAANPKEDGNPQPVSLILKQNLSIYLTVLLAPLIYKLLVLIIRIIFPTVAATEYGFCPVMNTFDSNM